MRESRVSHLPIIWYESTKPTRGTEMDVLQLTTELHWSEREICSVTEQSVGKLPFPEMNKIEFHSGSTSHELSDRLNVITYSDLLVGADKV